MKKTTLLIVAFILSHIGFSQKEKLARVVAGFPDLTIWPNSDQPILFIEMKRIKGGKVSEAQLDWMGYFERLHITGFPIRAAVCEGCGEAIKFIKSWGY
jgi:hypothetical protein